MKKHLVSMIAFSTLISAALSAYAQPDGEKKKGPPDGKKGFVLGKVLPPQVREKLDLSDAQLDKIDAIEKEVKSKLEKILTPDQLRTVQEMMEKKGDKGGKEKKGDKGPPDGKDKKKGDKDKKGDKSPPDAKKDDKGFIREEASLTPRIESIGRADLNRARRDTLAAMHA